MRPFILFLFTFSPSLVVAGWTAQSSGTTSTLYSVDFVDEKNGWTVGALGTVLHTTNGGDTWVNQSSGTMRTLHSVFFLDQNIGWAVGGLFVTGTIIHTTDGGAHWSVQSIGELTFLQSVCFTSTAIGWAAGYAGRLYHTSDAGAQWVRRGSDTYSWLRSIHFSGRHGWAVGTDGGITHTSNDGNSWTAQSGGLINDLNSVFFLDENNGWVVGGYPSTAGHILHTTDGGNVWTEQVWSGDWLYSVFFPGASNGWAVGIHGTISHTTNEGVEWAHDQSGTDAWLRSVQFVGEINGWAVGDNGTILHYHVPPVTATITPADPPIIIPPSGGSYEFTVTLTNNTTLPQEIEMWSVITPVGQFSPHTIGPNHTGLSSELVFSRMEVQGVPGNAAAGDYLHILNAGVYPDSIMSSDTMSFAKLGAGLIKMAEQENSFSQKDPGFREHRRIRLEQNSPNPFNPSTEIRFQVRDEGWVTLQVFDLVGRSVATLVDERLVPGSYERTFDADRLPSGVYLYRLNTRSYTETRKLLLLR